jgi:hypothetical protein
VYWEACGVSIQEELDISLRLENVDGGWLSRALQVVGIGGEGRSTVSWKEPVEAPGPFKSVLTLDLRGVDSGLYDLVVEVTTSDGTRLTRRRRLEVIEEPEAGRQREHGGLGIGIRLCFS